MQKETNSYLKLAKRYYKFAKKKLIEAKKEKNDIRAQQAAEKGYLSLLRTVDALLIKCGEEEEKLPKNEHHRVYCLRRYADRDFRRKYAAIRHNLHINAFHNAIIDYKILLENFDDLESLINTIENKNE